MNRRQFLASLAGTGALALLGAGGNTPRTIRVGLIGSAAPGAQLGAEEAGRTAELLGARFELVTGGDPEDVLVLVGDAAAPEELEMPLLVTRSTEAQPLHRHVFHMASSPAERRDALARWSGPLPEGARVVDWHPSLSRFGAEQLNQRYETRFGSPMDETAWASWMAVMIAAEVVLRNPGVGSGELSSRLERLRFDGHKGARLWFRDHRLVQPLYVVAGDKVLGDIAPEEEE